MNRRIRFEGDKVLARGSNNQTLCYIKDINHCKVYAADGIHRYQITRLAYVEGDHLTHTTYSYPSECTPEHFGKIQRIDHPEGRTLGINYFFSGKVSQLVAPTGTDQTLHPIATFGYMPNTCDVTGPHGESINGIYSCLEEI